MNTNEGPSPHPPDKYSPRTAAGRRQLCNSVMWCYDVLVQMTDLSSSSGRSYGYTGGYKSNYDAASRTFGGSSNGTGSDRTLGYLSAYGGVSSLKEKFDVSGRRAGGSSGYTSSLDRYAGRSTDYSGRLGSAYSSDYDLSRPSTASSRSYSRTSSYTPSVARATSPVWSSNRSTRPDYRYCIKAQPPLGSGTGPPTFGTWQKLKKCEIGKRVEQNLKSYIFGFPRDTMHCAAAAYAVVRCPTVRLSRSCSKSKQLNISSNIFNLRQPHHSTFRTPVLPELETIKPTIWQYSDGQYSGAVWM